MKHILSLRYRDGIITCQIWYSDLIFWATKGFCHCFVYEGNIVKNDSMPDWTGNWIERDFCVVYIASNILHASIRTIRRKTIEAPNNYCNIVILTSGHSNQLRKSGARYRQCFSSMSAFQGPRTPKKSRFHQDYFCRTLSSGFLHCAGFIEAPYTFINEKDSFTFTTRSEQTPPSY